MTTVAAGASILLGLDLWLPAGAHAQESAGGQAAAELSPAASGARELIDRYCVTCHNGRLETAGLSLDDIDVAHVPAEAETWENVVRKLRTSTMPPPNRPQPPAEARAAMASWLESTLDAAAAATPNPGRTETLRRLNRTEYQNAIRDLLALDVDATTLLPPDESGHGFDNVTVGDLPPALLDRYISAAQKISRLVIGTTQTSLQADVIRVPADTTQEEHVPGAAPGHPRRRRDSLHVRPGRRVRHPGGAWPGTAPATSAGCGTGGRTRWRSCSTASPSRASRSSGRSAGTTRSSTAT